MSVEIKSSSKGEVNMDLWHNYILNLQLISHLIECTTAQVTVQQEIVLLKIMLGDDNSRKSQSMSFNGEGIQTPKKFEIEASSLLN